MDWHNFVVFGIVIATNPLPVCGVRLYEQALSPHYYALFVLYESHRFPKIKPAQQAGCFYMGNLFLFQLRGQHFVVFGELL